MPKYLLRVDYHGGVVDVPMSDWAPEDVKAHTDYYRDQLQEVTDSGELVDQHALTGPELAKIVTAGAGTAPVVTDGPFAEFNRDARRLPAGRRRVRGAGD
jgi:hypothetical protein